MGEAGHGSCPHSGRAGYPGRGQETCMSHPGSQGHTGRFLAPEGGSGRCLRWHRVLENSRTAALWMERENEMEPWGHLLQVLLTDLFTASPHARLKPPCPPYPCSSPHVVSMPGLSLLLPNTPLSCLFSSLPSPALDSIPRKQDNRDQEGGQGGPRR